MQHQGHFTSLRHSEGRPTVGPSGVTGDAGEWIVEISGRAGRSPQSRLGEPEPGRWGVGELLLVACLCAFVSEQQGR